MKHPLLPSLLAALLILAGCATTPSGQGTGESKPAPASGGLGSLFSGTPKLAGTRWAWIETSTAAGRTPAPRTGLYLLDFAGEGYVRVTADCNRGSAKYSQDGKQLAMGPVALTKMACPGGGQGGRFSTDLSHMVQLGFVENNLQLSAAGEGTIMRFAPLKLSRYTCQGGLKFSLVDLPGSDVAIEFDGRFVRAGQVSAASGVAYEAPNLRFQGKGGEAMLDMGELSLRNCRLNGKG
ncbi:META domain-containing protein [Chitinimonas sp.]|uniref:META domain-containing protein n=1 Tax=Chitinimonas sp. TaxID=1934313 RepID=UPI002F9273F4